MTTSIRSKLTYTQVASTTADRVLTFDVTASFEPVEGDLPVGVKGVFVMLVTVPDDPKSDRFVRVATLADLGRVANTRELAIDDSRFYPAARNYIRSRAEGPSLLYLSPVLTSAISDTNVAVQFKAELEQRIDSLIRDWKYFRDAFFVHTSVEFPLTASALVTAARSKFHNAVTDYVTKKTTQKTAGTAYTDATATLQALTEERDRFDGVKTLVCPKEPYTESFLVPYRAYFVSGAQYRGGLRGAAAAAASFLATAASAMADENPSKVTYTLVVGQLTSALGAEQGGYSDVDSARLNYLEPVKTAVEDACAELDDIIDSLSTSIAAANTAVTNATTAQSVASAATLASQAALSTAYTELMAVCPAYEAETDKEMPEMGEWRTPILALLADTLS